MAAFGGLAKAGLNVQKPAKPAPSIIGQAMGAHPSWFPRQSLAGVGQAGLAGLGAGALSQPQATPAPAQPAAPGAQPAGSPLDSTYYNDVANYLFNTNQKIGGLQGQQGNLDTSLQAALGNLAYQQPRDQLKLEQGANQGGALFSSVYGQHLGDLNHSYLTKQTAAQTQHDQAYGALAAQIAGLQATEDPNSPTMLGFALGSTGRAATAAANNPALGAAPAPAPVAAPAAAPKPPAAPKATGVGSALLNGFKLLGKGKKR